MTVRAEAFDDPEPFAAAVDVFIRADPVRSTVLATVLADVLLGVRGYPGATWIAAQDGDEVVGVAMQTPPHRLWLSEMSGEAARAVAGVMAERAPAGGLPGIAGERDAAETAARRWLELRPNETLMEVRAVRAYTLGVLRQPRDVPGRARLASHSDRGLLLEWQRAFCEETQSEMPEPEAATDARLDGHGAFLLWERDNAPVSLAGHTALVTGTARVGPVYTPPADRSRGYGAAITAAAAKHASDMGAARISLFTDLANPTSNSIYQAIGYNPGADFVELDCRMQ